MSDVPSVAVDESADAMSISLHSEFAVASLRHFDDGEAFTAALVAALGSAAAAVPKPLRVIVASRAGAPTAFLARRSMTETLLLCSDGGPQLSALALAVAERSDVAVVDQTGGVRVWRLTGPRVSELLTRLGSVTAIPEVGQALTGRLGEVSAMTLCVAPGEVWLLVDRVYEQHFTAWVRQAIADL